MLENEVDEMGKSPEDCDSRSTTSRDTVHTGKTMMASGIQCWQCLTEGCHLDPLISHASSKRHCQEGQSCQKVEYRGKDDKSNVVYSSVVRSCSLGKCVSHHDNCTENLLTNPGCMIRYCCNDQNLCNSAIQSYIPHVVLYLISCTLALFHTDILAIMDITSS